MNPAVKRWVATTYHLPLEQIEDVTFEVEDAAGAADLTARLVIEVRLVDGTQHLVTRCARDFGAIVNEVVAAAG